MDTVALAVQMKADASDVVDGFDDVAAAAKDMAGDVSRAAADVDAAAGKLDNVSASAENLDSTASKATGALGALSSGFELVGLDQYAGGLQAAAMATDFASGAGQALNLVLGLESVQRAKAAAQAVAQGAATVATTAATKAAAAGQYLLNAALLANPIGLVIVAAVALVGLFVLLYNKSDTFRNIVQAVGEAGKTALGFIVDKATDLYKYVSDKLTPVFDGIGPAVGLAKDLVVGYFDTMTTPIRTVVNLVQDLIGWISKIDFPDLPDLGKFIPGRFAAPGAGGSTGYAGGAAPMGAAQIVNLYVTAPPTLLDLQSFAQLIILALRQQGVAVGTPA